MAEDADDDALPIKVDPTPTASSGRCR